MKKENCKISQEIVKIYSKRKKAHEMLLECDIEINKIMKKLIKNSNPVKKNRSEEHTSELQSH